MFSGKSTELLRRVRRAQIAGQKVLLLKPSCDTRYTADAVVTHDNASVTCVTVDNLWEMPPGDWDVVAIDEAQFFERGSGIEDFPYYLVSCEGVRVIIAGLDVDYAGRPFGDMPYLLAQADQVTKLSAVCVQCGKDAARTYRKQSDSQQVLLGAEDAYEARCRTCWGVMDH